MVDKTTGPVTTGIINLVHLSLSTIVIKSVIRLSISKGSKVKHLAVTVGNKRVPRGGIELQVDPCSERPMSLQGTIRGYLHVPSRHR